MNKEVDILIVGGGITGISLSSFLGDTDHLIVERDSELGGYCKTTIRNGFVWDYSGHFFHFNNQDIKDYVLENMGCDVIEVTKKTHINYKNNIIDFPFQNNIHQLPVDEFVECLYDLYNKKDGEIKTFTDFVKNTLGESICDKFIIPYNQKLYACELDKLDYDAMGRFFPKPTNFNDLLSQLKNKNKMIYYESFYEII